MLKLLKLSNSKFLGQSIAHDSKSRSVALWYLQLFNFPLYQNCILNLSSRAPWSCGLMRHVLNREVGGSNLSKGKNLFYKNKFFPFNRNHTLFLSLSLLYRFVRFVRSFVREKMVRFELAIRLYGQRQTWKNMERKMI